MFELSRLTHGDTDLANDIALLHCDAFKGYFLSSLGRRFLQEYYYAFAQDPSSEIFLAKKNSELVGFIVFSKQPQAVIKDMIKANLSLVMTSVLKQVLSLDIKFICRLVVRATRFLLNLTSKSSPLGRGHRHIRLLSIATVNRERGSGVTSRLLDFSISSLKKANFESVGLTVFSNNAAAVGFYMKHGFRLEKTKGDMLFFVRDFDG